MERNRVLTEFQTATKSGRRPRTSPGLVTTASITIY